MCKHVAFISQQCSATDILDSPRTRPHKWKIGILSLNSPWVMIEWIADCAKKIELISRYSYDCVHDVWVVLIDGGCKRAC